jgi:hypothetical protein
LRQLATARVIPWRIDYPKNSEELDRRGFQSGDIRLSSSVFLPEAIGRLCFSGKSRFCLDVSLSFQEAMAGSPLQTTNKHKQNLS